MTEQNDPSAPEETASQLREIALYGNMTQSYKLALGAALAEIAPQGESRIPLEVLAGPFADHICRHLSEAPIQGTAPSSRFLDACRYTRMDESRVTN